VKSCELTTDLRGLITQASEDAATLLAIEPKWLVKKPLAAFISEGDRRRFRSLLLELERGERSRDGTFVLLNRAHAEIPAELAATQRAGGLAWKLAPSSGKLASGSITPGIEEPQHDRGFLRERQFHQLLTRLPQGVVIINRQLGVEYANPAAARMLGAANVRAGERLLDPWPDPSLRELAASLFTSRPTAGRHLVSVGEKTVSIEGLPSSRASTAVLLLDDVTERERARQAERQFVENAAHELRTPLAAILGAIDVLEGGAAEDENSRQQFLGHIRAQSERLRRVSTSLLVLARVHVGVENLHLDLIAVKPLLEEVAGELEPASDVGIEVHAPADLGVLADGDLLHHAIGNVAANACKYTRVGRVSLVGRDLGRAAEIVIVDSGPGMSALARRHAFDRFYRSSDGTSGGFGLGLAIAREAVQALDGAIDLDSGPDGTTVRIWLPNARLTY
jgi:signal transduction histidine kinase